MTRQQNAVLSIGPDAPNDEVRPGDEYVWIQTDGAGNVEGIKGGIAPAAPATIAHTPAQLDAAVTAIAEDPTSAFAVSQSSTFGTLAAPGLTITNPRGLRRWAAALSDAKRGLATVTVVGDSITYGVGSDGTASSDLPLTFREDGYVGVLRDLLAEQYGDPGEGYYYYYCGGYALAGGASLHPSSGPFGVATRATSASHTITVTVQDATTVLFYTWDGGSGTCSYAVDGGGSTNFSAGSGNTSLVTWTTHTISGLSAGSHTIVFTGPSSGTLYLAGVDARKGTTGVLVHRLGRAGSTTANLVGLDMATYNNPTGIQRLTEAIYKVTTANLYVLALGANDYYNQNTTTASSQTYPGTTASQYGANLQQIADMLIAQGGCVLLLTPPLTPNLASPETYTQAQYAAAARDVAASTDHCAHLSIADVYGTAAEGYALGLYPTNSTIHPSRRGHGLIAHALHRALTLPLGSGAPGTTV